MRCAPAASATTTFSPRAERSAPARPSVFRAILSTRQAHSMRAGGRRTVASPARPRLQPRAAPSRSSSMPTSRVSNGKASRLAPARNGPGTCAKSALPGGTSRSVASSPSMSLPCATPVPRHPPMPTISSGRSHRCLPGPSRAAGARTIPAMPSRSSRSARAMRPGPGRQSNISPRTRAPISGMPPHSRCSPASASPTSSR
jgi:hypothetical protein